jgi:hypothetical protein
LLVGTLFVSLVYCGWKYCSLVCCERKTLLDGCWFCWSSETNRVKVLTCPSVQDNLYVWLIPSSTSYVYSTTQQLITAGKPWWWLNQKHVM